MKTLPDHRAADVYSLSDLGLFTLPRAAGRTLMSMAALIRAGLEYSASVWDPYKTTETDKLEKVQQRAEVYDLKL